MTEDLLTEEYDDEQDAERGRRSRWAEGWLVRRRREVEVEDQLSFPDPGMFLVGMVSSIAIGLGFRAFKRKQSRKRIEVVYERSNDS